jgi:hypothetical protein
MRSRAGIRGRRGLFVASVLVAAVAVGLYFGVFRSGPDVLDRGAVAVAGSFTREAWNDHNCRAASRYLADGQLCASMGLGGMIPVWSHFSLASHRIQRSGCRLSNPPGYPQRPITAGCVEYTANSGFLLRYGMTQTPAGWRIVEIGISGMPGTPAAHLDRAAVTVTDAFTRLAWNSHDCLRGRRYLLPGIVGGACPTHPTGTFSVKTHRIRPNSCGHGDWNGGYRISPGCVDYTASDGETLEYDLTKTPQGWRIIGTGTSSP